MFTLAVNACTPVLMGNMDGRGQSPGGSPSRTGQLSPPVYLDDNPQPLSLKMEKPVYSSPQPVVSNNPENNVCKLIDYRNAKVAAFVVEGRELICLPQAFDLFLKHLVGGLHTVYTKLKRLEITPVVCNVEQVRILRGLGAIQPGVNRCKLISCKEFDILYEDCTSSSARPGRPPKRAPSSHCTPDIEKFKKSRLDGTNEYLYGNNRLLSDKSPTLTNGYHHYPHHLSMLPFMPVSYPAMTSAASMVMGGHPLGVAMDATGLKERSAGDEADSISPRSHPDKVDHDGGHRLDYHVHTDHYRQTTTDKESGKWIFPGIGTANDLSNSGPINMKKSTLEDRRDREEMDGENHSEDDDDDDYYDGDTSPPHTPNDTMTKTTSTQKSSYPVSALTSNGDISSVPSSLDGLLMNIYGLLKVAVEHAKHFERQANYEKAELKMEVLREREMRDSLERQLLEKQRLKDAFIKRWKKEKKARRRLQDQLEADHKLPLHLDEENRCSVSPEPQHRSLTPPEAHSRTSTPPETHRYLNGTSMVSQTVIHAIKSNG